MKKIIFLSTMFVVSYLFCACALPIQIGEIIKQERPVAGNFSKLKVSNAVNVIVTMADSENVVVESNEKIMSYVKVQQVGNELSLSIANPPRTWNSSNVTIYVKAKNLEDIDISGVSKLTMANVLKTNKLKLDMSGASLIDLNVEVQVLKSEISGASKVNLQGIAKTCELDISGASKVDASDLSVNDYDCEVSGASSATVWCTASMGVEASGASTVQYKGNPVMKKMEVSGASSVKQSN